MNFTPALIYDAAVAIIIISLTAAGAKKGFVKMAILCLGYIACFAAAMVISRTASPVIYEQYIREPLVSLIEAKITDAGIDVKSKICDILEEEGIYADREKIGEITDKIAKDDPSEGESAADIIMKYLPEEATEFTKQEINDKLKEFTDSLDLGVSLFSNKKDNDENTASGAFMTALLSGPHEIAEYAEENFLRSEVIYMLRSLLFFVIFGVSMPIVRRIARASSVVKKIPVAGKANTVLGGAAGFCEAMLYIALFTAVLRLVVGFSGGVLPFANEDIINDTIFYKYIYNMSLLPHNAGKTGFGGL